MSTQLHAVGPEGMSAPSMEALQTPDAVELLQAIHVELSAMRGETASQIQALTERVNALESGQTAPIAEQAQEPAPSEPAEEPAPARAVPPREPRDRGNGGGNNGGNGRGGEGSGSNDPDRRKNFLKKAGAVVVIGAVAVAGVLGIQRLTDDGKSKKGPNVEREQDSDRGSQTRQTGPASKLGLSAGEFKRLAPVANHENVDTIAETTRTYKGANLDQAVADILGNPEAFRNVDISHFKNRYNHTSAFTPEGISTQNALEAKLIAIVQDAPNAQSALNLIEGRNITADRDDSHDEQIARIKKFLLDNDTKIDGNFRLNGVWGNGNVNDQTEELGVKDFRHDNRRAVRITGANGAEWVFSLDSASEADEDLCLNDQERREQPVEVSSPSPDISTPTPVTKPKPEPKPKPTPKPEPEVEPEVEQPGPKVDRTPGRPGGNDGQNGGSGTAPSGPTGPGTGPAGQAPRPDGGVGGEVLPTAPVRDPTPAPIAVEPAPTVVPGEVVGAPTTAPAEGATGTAGTDDASTNTVAP